MTTDAPLLVDARAQAHASATIAAPIGLVWQVMTDVDAYGAWNPFIVAARLPQGLAVDAPVGLSVRMGGWPSRVTEIIEHVDPPGPEGQARWVYRLAGVGPALGAVRARRLQRLTALDPHTTRYETVDAFGGWLAALVPVRAVQRGLEAMAQGLARRSESLAKVSAQAQNASSGA